MDNHVGGNLSNYHLNTNETWVVKDDKLEKVPEQKGLLGKLVSWLSGGSISKVVNTVGQHVDKIQGTDRKHADALISLKKGMEQSYNKTGAVLRLVDSKLHRGNVTEHRDQILDRIYSKLDQQFFPTETPKGELTGKDKYELDKIHEILTTPNPDEGDKAGLDKMLDNRFGGDANQKFQWYEAMAHNGYPTASFHLAQHFEENAERLGPGPKVGGVDTRAVAHYEKAANGGCLAAQLKLAQAYRTDGNAEEAHKWTTKAASKNDEAWLQLAVDLAEGSGVPKNPEAAAGHLSAIIEKTQNPEIRAKAFHQLGHLAEGIRNTDAKARYEQAAKMGNKDAKIDRLRLAKESNDTELMYRLAQEMEQGIGGHPDLKDAVELYKQLTTSAHEGSPRQADALMRMAELTIPKHLDTGIVYYKRALRAGRQDAGVKLLELIRDNPNAAASTHASKNDVAMWVSNSLPALLAKEAASTMGPDSAKKNLEAVENWTDKAGIATGLVMNDPTPKAMFNKIQALSPQDQEIIRNLIAIGKKQAPDGNLSDDDHDLLASALFGKQRPSAQEIAVVKAII